MIYGGYKSKESHFILVNYPLWETRILSTSARSRNVVKCWGREYSFSFCHLLQKKANFSAVAIARESHLQMCIDYRTGEIREHMNRSTHSVVRVSEEWLWHIHETHRNKRYRSLNKSLGKKKISYRELQWLYITKLHEKRKDRRYKTRELGRGQILKLIT